MRAQRRGGLTTNSLVLVVWVGGATPWKCAVGTRSLDGHAARGSGRAMVFDWLAEEQLSHLLTSNDVTRIDIGQLAAPPK